MLTAGLTVKGSFTVETLEGLGSTSELLVTRAAFLFRDQIIDFFTGEADDDIIDGFNIEPFTLAEVGEPGLEEVPGEPDG